MSTNTGNDPEFDKCAPKPSPRRGPRIGELVAALAVIGLLAVFLLPASRSAGPASRRVQCVNNLKQIGLALYSYQEAYQALPPAYTVDAEGRPLHSWRTLILPFLGEVDLYRSIDLSKPWNDPANAKAMAASPLVYLCPSSDGPPGRTTYLAIVGADGRLIQDDPGRPAWIADLPRPRPRIIEAGELDAVPWMAPVDADASLLSKLGPARKLHHPSGANVLLSDASVRFLRADTPDRLREELRSISGAGDESTETP